MNEAELSAAAQAITQLFQYATEDSHVLIAWDDPDGGGILGGPSADPDEATQRLNTELLDRVHELAAMATRVAWSPDASPTTLAWALTVVHKDHQAIFLVKRVVEDDQWWRLHSTDAPWFMLSTASGLRAAMVEGKTMEFKDAKQNRDVLQTPQQKRHPRRDARGNI